MIALVAALTPPAIIEPAVSRMPPRDFEREPLLEAELLEPAARFDEPAREEAAFFGALFDAAFFGAAFDAAFFGAAFFGAAFVAPFEAVFFAAPDFEAALLDVLGFEAPLLAAVPREALLVRAPPPFAAALLVEAFEPPLVAAGFLAAADFARPVSDVVFAAFAFFSRSSACERLAAVFFELPLPLPELREALPLLAAMKYPRLRGLGSR